jgi:hypothetical protein
MIELNNYLAAKRCSGSGELLYTQRTATTQRCHHEIRRLNALTGIFAEWFRGRLRVLRRSPGRERQQIFSAVKSFNDLNGWNVLNGWNSPFAFLQALVSEPHVEVSFFAAL